MLQTYSYYHFVYSCTVCLPLIALIQISYTPVGVGDDIGHYQLFPSQTNFVDGVVTIVKTFGWRQLSILTQSEPPFIQASEPLLYNVVNYNLPGDVQSIQGSRKIKILGGWGAQPRMVC